MNGRANISDNGINKFFGHKNRIKPQGRGLQLYPVFIDVMGKNQEETQFAMDCPIMMQAGLLGFEIVGYFNITNLSDNQFIDFISHGVKKAHRY
jgi:hypothetical protein